jgi:hypothetical protein
MKTLTTKPACKTITNKAIEAATLELACNVKQHGLLIEVFSSAIRFGSVTQFKAIKKGLVISINKRQGWEYKSLDAIYRDGFGVKTPLNIISFFSTFCKIKADLLGDEFDHDAVVEEGYTAIVNAVEDYRAAKRAEAASNDELEAEQDSDDAEAHAEMINELEQEMSVTISPAHQQAIDLLLQLDEEQVSAVTRTLGSLLQDKQLKIA